MSINRCGATANTSGPGLAVPISIPRYTKAESTLTISQGSRRTNSTAKPVLPEAVGPMRKMAVGRDVMARDRPITSHRARRSAAWVFDNGGEGGIRSPGPLRANGFQVRRFRPLSHLSYLYMRDIGGRERWTTRAVQRQPIRSRQRRGSITDHRIELPENEWENNRIGGCKIGERVKSAPISCYSCPRIESEICKELV